MSWFTTPTEESKTVPRTNPPDMRLAEADARVRRAHANDAAAFRTEQRYLKTHRPPRTPWIKNDWMMAPVSLQEDEPAEARRLRARKAATHKELMDALAARAGVMRELGLIH